MSESDEHTILVDVGEQPPGLVDHAKVRRLTAAVVDVLNEQKVTTAEASLLICNIYLSVIGCAEPQDRWTLRTMLIGMLLKAGVRQDSAAHVHREHGTAQ